MNNGYRDLQLWDFNVRRYLVECHPVELGVLRHSGSLRFAVYWIGRMFLAVCEQAFKVLNYRINCSTNSSTMASADLESRVWMYREIKNIEGSREVNNPIVQSMQGTIPRNHGERSMYE